MTILLLYTDPGSGVMLLQVLLAFVAGGIFYFRNLIKRIFGFGKVRDNETEGSTSESGSEPQKNA